MAEGRRISADELAKQESELLRREEQRAEHDRAFAERRAVLERNVNELVARVMALEVDLRQARSEERRARAVLGSFR